MNSDALYEHAAAFCASLARESECESLSGGHPSDRVERTPADDETANPSSAGFSFKSLPALVADAGEMAD